MGCTGATFSTTIKKWVSTHIRLVPISIKSNPVLAAKLLATEKFMQFFDLLEEGQKTQSKPHSVGEALLPKTSLRYATTLPLMYAQ